MILTRVILSFTVPLDPTVMTASQLLEHCKSAMRDMLPVGSDNVNCDVTQVLAEYKCSIPPKFKQRSNT